MDKKPAFSRTFTQAETNEAARQTLSLIENQLSSLSATDADTIKKLLQQLADKIALEGELGAYRRFGDYQREMEKSEDADPALTERGMLTIDTMLQQLNITIDPEELKRVQFADDAAVKVITEMNSGLQALPDPHDPKNIIGLIHDVRDKFIKEGEEGVYIQFDKSQRRMAAGKFKSHIALMGLSGMRTTVRELGIKLDPARMKLVQEAADRVEAQRKLRQQGEMDLKPDFSDPELIKRMIPIDQIGDSPPYSRHSYESLLEKNNVDVDTRHKAGLAYRHVMDGTIAALKRYDPEWYNPMAYFNEAVDAALAINGVHDFKFNEIKPTLREYTYLWREDVKHRVFGAQYPDPVRDAMKAAIEQVITPVRQGKTLHPGIHVDASLAGKAALSLQRLADNFQERHDLALYIRESDAYRSAQGNPALHALVNQTLSEFSTLYHAKIEARGKESLSANSAEHESLPLKFTPLPLSAPSVAAVDLQGYRRKPLSAILPPVDMGKSPVSSKDRILSKVECHPQTEEELRDFGHLRTLAQANAHSHRERQEARKASAEEKDNTAPER